MSKDLVNAFRTVYDTISNDYQRSYELKRANDNLIWQVKAKVKYIADTTADYNTERESCLATNTTSTKLESLDRKLDQAEVTLQEFKKIQLAMAKVLETQNIDTTPRRTLAEMPARDAETIDNSKTTPKQLKSEV